MERHKENEIDRIAYESNRKGLNMERGGSEKKKALEFQNSGAWELRMIRLDKQALYEWKQQH